jgi:hypothetical protein
MLVGWKQGKSAPPGTPFSPTGIELAECRRVPWEPAILNRGRNAAANAGGWARLHAGARGHFRLRLQGRPAGAADPHSK